MKKYKRLITGCMWALYFILFAVTIMIPSVKLSSNGQSVSLGMIDIFCSGSIDLNEGAVEANQFYGILLASCFVATPVLGIVDNEITKYISFGISVVLLSLSIGYVRQIDLLKEMSSSVRLETPGIILLLITTIVGTAFSLIDMFVSNFLPQLVETIDKKIKANNKLSLLEENKAMLDKGLISEEEYSERKRQILGE